MFRLVCMPAECRHCLLTEHRAHYASAAVQPNAQVFARLFSPVRVTLPSGSTTVSDRTLSLMVPYRTAAVPLALQTGQARRGVGEAGRACAWLAGQLLNAALLARQASRLAWLPPCRRVWHLLRGPRGRTGQCPVTWGSSFHSRLSHLKARQLL